MESFLDTVQCYLLMFNLFDSEGIPNDQRYNVNLIMDDISSKFARHYTVSPFGFDRRHVPFEQTISTANDPSHLGQNLPLDLCVLTIGRLTAKTKSFFLKNSLFDLFVEGL